MGARDRGDRLERAASGTAATRSAARLPIGARPHRDRQLHRPRGRDRRRPHDRGRRARRPALDAARVRAARRAAIELDGDDVHVPPDQDSAIRDDVGGQIPKIEDGPWPAFPADLTRSRVAVATQARGDDPRSSRRCSRTGCSSWTSSSTWARGSSSATRTAPSSAARRSSTASGSSSPDIRAGMAMLIAALCAEGTVGDRQRRARSTAATSGSTSACARSARASSAWRPSPSRRKSGTPMTCAAPRGPEGEVGRAPERGGSRRRGRAGSSAGATRRGRAGSSAGPARPEPGGRR